MNDQLEAPGFAQTVYVPAGSFLPSTITSVEIVSGVHSLAPGHHTRPYGTSAPNSSRPRATGRSYSIVSVVPATSSLTVPCWPGFTYACAVRSESTASAATMPRSYRTSDLGPRTSVVGPRASDLRPRTSDVGRRSSVVGRRTSDLGRRASDVGPRTSDLGRRTSD